MKNMSNIECLFGFHTYSRRYIIRKKDYYTIQQRCLICNIFQGGIKSYGGWHRKRDAQSYIDYFEERGI